MLENKRRNPLQMAMDTVSGCMQPIIPVLLGCGIIKLLVLLLDFTGVFAGLGVTKEILTCVNSAPFYFLPMILAYTAAMYFKCNPCYAIACVCVMLFPDFTAMMEADKSLFFLGVPIVKASYAYSVVPVIVLVWLVSKLQHFFETKIPSAVRDIFSPALTILVGALLGIIVVGPPIALISERISGGMTFLQTNYPIVAWMLMSGLFPVFVITGVSWVFVAIMLQQLGTFGVENGFHVSAFMGNMAIAASCMAVMLKTRRAEIKKVAASAGTTVFAVGVSEPALFGIMLPLKTPLACVMASCAIGGIWQALNNLHTYVFAVPGIFTILAYSSPNEPGNLKGVLIAAGISSALAFISTYFFYREK